jgi:hypothetical protein
MMKLKFKVHSVDRHPRSRKIEHKGVAVMAEVPHFVVQLTPVDHSDTAGSLTLELLDQRIENRGTPEGQEERRKAFAYVVGEVVTFQRVEEEKAS